MRRAGQNPTDIEVQDLINKIDDGSGTLDFNDFCLVIKEKTKEVDTEIHFKDTFRVFSKDEEGKKVDLDLHLLLFPAGCIPADEMKFVLMHLPGKVTYKEIDEMIETVDKNGDGKISFSEFRYQRKQNRNDKFGKMFQSNDGRNSSHNSRQSC